MKIGHYSDRWGNYVLRHRKLRRLTTRSLAERARVDQSYICLIQRGYVPSLHVVDRLSAALNVSQDEARLMAGFGPRNPTRLLKLVQQHEIETSLTPAMQAELLTVTRLSAEDQDCLARFIHAFLEGWP